MITSCTKCNKAFDAASEESANESERYCPICWWQIWDSGTEANDHNRRVYRGQEKGLISNPYGIGTLANKRWLAGYYMRDMINDG